MRRFRLVYATVLFEKSKLIGKDALAAGEGTLQVDLSSFCRLMVFMRHRLKQALRIGSRVIRLRSCDGYVLFTPYLCQVYTAYD